MTPQHPSVRDSSARRLLLALGSAMIGAGQAVYEVEIELRRVATQLGHHQAQINATPTVVTVALSPSDTVAMLVVRQSLRLDQAVAVNHIRRELLYGNLGIAPALAQLAQIRQAKRRYGWWGQFLGWVIIAVGICLIFQPNLPNVLLTALFAAIVWGISRIFSRHSLLSTILPVAAAFVTSLGIFGAYQLGLLQGPLRTLVCPIAILLPGATLATGLAELAAGMMMAGTARVVYGVMQLVLFATGTIGAVMVLRPDWVALSNVRVTGLGWFAVPFGLLAVSVGIVLSESLPWWIFPWALLTLAVTFTAQTLAGKDQTLTSFLGAVTASFLSAAIEACQPKIPKLLIFLPSFWLLVPGATGVLGLIQLGADGNAPLGTVFTVIGVFVAIAVGLLIGSALARPVYIVARRHRNRIRKAERRLGKTQAASETQSG